MRRSASLPVALALGLALAAGPALAQGGAASSDLVYRHAAGGSGLLEGSDGKAWWVLLSECAGFYGAMANARDDAGDTPGYEQYRDRGVASYRAAVARLRADRGLDSAAAGELVRPRIDQARAVAEAHLARNPSTGYGANPMALLRSTCLDLEEVYADAAR